jgi:restriction endonuclease S subunit
MGNLRNGHLDVSDLKHVELASSDIAHYRLRPGDILINRTNSLEHVGKAAVFNLQGGPWVYASYLVRLVVNKRRALPEYVAAVINSRIGRAYVARTARRAIGMVNINVREIGAMSIPLPTLDAQDAIVQRMAEARVAIRSVRASLAAFNDVALHSAILRKAFAGEL